MDLLDDVFTILDLEKMWFTNKRLSGNEEQIGGFEVLYKGGPVKVAHNPAGVSILGAFNNREQQTKKLAKQTVTRPEKQSIETLNQQNKQQKL